MKYTEAFKALGYTLANQRQHWSAESDQGVCISLWQSETAFDKVRKTSWCDTREMASALEQWKDKAGNKKRIEHLSRAMREFDGFVDVVIVAGTPGGSFGDAHPWHPQQYKNTRWKLSYFDPETGHFAASAVAL